MSDLRHLFSPFAIGSLKLKNRIVMPAMGTYYADLDGVITDRQIAYYLERIKGGGGYITSEHTGVMKEAKFAARMALICSDQHLPGFRRLTDAVHQEGGKIVIQLNHPGRTASSSITGSPIVAPSAIPCPARKEMPRELSVMEIREIVEAFARAALRVKEAGADGVEIHMAHGYLINQFLSPLSNKRTDEYGGDLEGRMRMAIEVLKTVKAGVGAAFPVLCRLSADEYVEDGLRIDDTQKIAKALESGGADGLHVTARWASSGWGLWSYPPYPPYYEDEGTFAHLAQRIKFVVNIPVILVGRIRTPELANRMIREGKADLIAMGRALIADPHLPKKALAGRAKEIIPCISCNRCVQSLGREGLRCAVNPRTGREAQFKTEKTKHPRKVWIIGGGPAGMKTAEIAAPLRAPFRAATEGRPYRKMLPRGASSGTRVRVVRFFAALGFT